MKKTKKDKSPTVGIYEAAKLAGVSPETIYRRYRLGKLPAASTKPLTFTKADVLGAGT